METEFKIMNIRSGERVNNFAPIATHCNSNTHRKQYNILNLEWFVYLAFQSGPINYTLYIRMRGSVFCKMNKLTGAVRCSD